MNFKNIIAAFAVPANSLVEQRVPKKLMLEQGAPTPADKRTIQDGIEELFWVAALKPTNIGVPAYRDETREYLEIELLTALFRDDAKAARLTELVHRAIPYPLLLLSAYDSRCTISVAHKRWSQGETGKVVLENGYPQITQIAADEETSNLRLSASSADQSFLNNLSLSKQPNTNLSAMYQGWVDCVIALQASRITHTFALPDDSAGGQALRDDLETHDRIERELVSLRARARKEKQMNRRVELNIEIKRLEGELAGLALSLAKGQL